jgi:hypothetical protein
MGKLSKESLLRHRKLLEMTLRELAAGKIRGARSHLPASGHFRLDTTDQRIASVQKRIAEVDDQIGRGDHA